MIINLDGPLIGHVLESFMVPTSFGSKIIMVKASTSGDLNNDVKEKLNFP